jgi:hypothetical protein
MSNAFSWIWALRSGHLSGYRIFMGMAFFQGLGGATTTRKPTLYTFCHPG